MLIIAFVMTTFSCNNQEEEILNNKDGSINLDEFGQAHVKGLNFVYDFLYKERVQNARINENQEVKATDIISATDLFLISEGFSKEDREDTKHFLNDFFKTEQSVYLDEDYKLTNSQISFILALEMIFDEEVSFEGSISLIEKLERKANFLPEDDKDFVLMSLVTARSQITYWHDHLLKWENEASLPSERGFCVSSWRPVGRAAIGGALTGASYCGVSRLFGTVGWKVWGTCIVGGAVAGAVSSIWNQCTDHMVAVETRFISVEDEHPELKRDAEELLELK